MRSIQRAAKQANTANPNKPSALVRTHGKPPALTELAQLDETLSALRKATHDHYDRNLEHWFEPDPHNALAAIKRVLPKLGKLRAQWREFDQPASFDLIAAEALKLTTTMPQASNINQQVLSTTLCQALAELRPTTFALERGCLKHFMTHPFLTPAELIKEIGIQEKRARLFRSLLAKDFQKLEAEYQEQVQERLEKK